MDKNYRGIIWTSHAIDRMLERGIKQGDAWATWKRPDSSKFEKTKGVWVYRRSIDLKSIEVVAKKNSKGRWVILSVWSKKLSLKSPQRTSFLAKIIKKVIRK